ncbi:hypothetical protein CXB35_28350 [Pseudomonas syringae]|nr:hypothetical protein CXB35_28350 [Pseudomonas syringae]
MPFRTLRVLFATQSVENCIPTLSVRNDNLNYRAEALRRSARTTHYRATLCVACLSGRSASSCDAERRELHSHAGA